MASILAILANTALVPFVRFVKISLTPVLWKTTVSSSVAAAIVAPWATVTTSLTVIVKAWVETEPLANKSSKTSASPLTVAVTVPVVAAKRALNALIFVELNASGASVTTTLTSASL